MPVLPAANGVYVRGVVVSNRAKAFKRKDGTGISVAVECEIALQPGVATWGATSSRKQILASASKMRS